MNAYLTSLSDDPQELKTIIIDKSKALHFFQQRAAHLEEQVQLLRSKLYGKKSEKILTPKDVNQLALFNEAEIDLVVEPEKSADEITVAPHTRKKSGRKPLPQDLPRVDVTHDIADSEKQCECGCEKVCIGRETAERLDYVPPQIRVIRDIRLKYACKNCEGADSDGPAVSIAPVPPQIIPKSICTAGLLAHILVSKFADALPFYRQEKMFARLGVDLPRATMANWTIHAAGRMRILVDLIKDEIRSGPLVNIDETPVQVLDEPGRSNTTKSYMWVFRGGTPGKPALIYQYHPSRSGDVPIAFLGDYSGYIQSDGYSGYDRLTRSGRIIHIGCWAHARRKFIEVINARKRNKGAGDQKTGSAEIAVDYIRKLYDIERDARKQEFPPDRVYELRQEKTKPILLEFKAWLDKKVILTPPQGLLGKAVNYCLDQWDKLCRYVDDGRVTIDNNLAENAIRPFVVGRKNWLFSGSPRGADASAAVYSIIETAKANHLEPYRYLRYLFAKIPFIENDAEYENLIPTRIDPQIIDQFFESGAIY
jgi:transposase